MMYESSKIIVLGGKSSGKTALVLRCLTGHFFPHPASTTDTAYHFEYNGNNMDIVDSKGRNEALISYADGIVLVYSITDKTSFFYLQTIINKVRRLNFKKDLKIVVVGTKCDKAKYREVSLYEGQEFAVDNKCLFAETSACIPKQNIQELFAQLLAKNTEKHINITLRTKKRRKESLDVTPPPSPTRRSFKIYDSVRNFVQKKRRQSTSDYCHQHYEKPSMLLNKDKSKSMIFL